MVVGMEIGEWMGIKGWGFCVQYILPSSEMEFGIDADVHKYSL